MRNILNKIFGENSNGKPETSNEPLISEEEIFDNEDDAPEEGEEPDLGGDVDIADFPKDTVKEKIFKHRTFTNRGGQVVIRSDDT